jgi:hypothetical protein
LDKFNIKTEELLQDLQARLDDLKARRASYEEDKIAYAKWKQETIQQAVYKIFERNVVSSTFYPNKIVLMAEVLMAELDTETMQAPVEVSEHQIKVAEKTLNLYKLCADESITITDQELKSILGI